MKAILLLLSAYLLCAPVQAQDYIDDPYLYYRIGGARAISQPATTNRIQFGSTSGLSGFACGNFNPLNDIESMLGGIGDSLPSLQALPTDMLSNLPGQLLCRAQPSLCQLTQHYSVRAEDIWRFSINACEDAQAEGKGANNDWLKLGQAQEWQRQALAGANADEARRAVADEEDPCVTWIGGRRAGCPGRPPIRPVRDTVTAGWCVVNGEPADCTSTGGNKTKSYAVEIWETPQEASIFAADIVGDVEITDGGTPDTYTPTGLQALVKKETEEVAEALNEVVRSPGYGTDETREKLDSPAVQVNTELINALRHLEGAEIYTQRIAEEIALARILDKALLVRRLLIKGLSEPNIQLAGAGKEDVTEAIKRLDAEIDRIVFEFKTRRAIVGETSIELLQAYARVRTPSVQPVPYAPHRLPN